MDRRKNFIAIGLLALLLLTHLEAQTKVERVGGHVSPPQLIQGSSGISQPGPNPKSRFKGVAAFSVIIDSEGQVAQAKLVHSTGHADLDQKALDMVRQWKFKPALKDGKPVAVYSNVEFNFNLY